MAVRAAAVEIYTRRLNPQPARALGSRPAYGASEKVSARRSRFHTNKRMEHGLDPRLESLTRAAHRVDLHRQHLRPRRHHEVAAPLEGQRLADLRQAAGQERRPVATPGRGGPPAHRRVALGQGPLRPPRERARRPPGRPRPAGSRGRRQVRPRGPAPRSPAPQSPHPSVAAASTPASTDPHCSEGRHPRGIRPTGPAEPGIPWCQPDPKLSAGQQVYPCHSTPHRFPPPRPGQPRRRRSTRQPPPRRLAGPADLPIALVRTLSVLVFSSHDQAALAGGFITGDRPLLGLHSANGITLVRPPAPCYPPRSSWSAPARPVCAIASIAIWWLIAIQVFSDSPPDRPAQSRSA